MYQTELQNQIEERRKVRNFGEEKTQKEKDEFRRHGKEPKELQS